MFDSQDIELVIKGKFDAVLDTIGGPETERISINFLKRGGHYMTLQVGDGNLLVLLLSKGPLMFPFRILQHRLIRLLSSFCCRVRQHL